MSVTCQVSSSTCLYTSLSRWQTLRLLGWRIFSREDKVLNLTFQFHGPPHGWVSIPDSTKIRWWFQMFYLFLTPILGGNDPIWRAYLSDGLVQPPASFCDRWVATFSVATTFVARTPSWKAEISNCNLPTSRKKNHRFTTATWTFEPRKTRKFPHFDIQKQLWTN